MAYKIAEYREAAGISQHELARRIGVNQRNVSNYESSDDVRVSIAIKIAESLDVPLYDLLGIEQQAENTLFPDSSKMSGYWNSLNNVGKSRLLDFARMLVQVPENVSSKSRRVHPLAG